MKWKYYIVVFFCLGVLFYAFFTFNCELAKAGEVKLKRLHKHEIYNKVSMTEEEEVNHLLSAKISEIKENFFEKLSDAEVQKNLSYTLYITNEIYSYKEYCSVVLFFEEYTGGAHPNTNLWTVVYDTKEHKIVDLEELISLEDVSYQVRQSLLINPRIVDTLWMMEGTTLKKENFSHYVLTEKGILFYFPPYQVAPYSSGTLEVLVLWQK